MALGLREVQILEHDVVKPLRGQDQRHLVDRRDVLGGDDRLFVHVAEQRDLALDVRVQESIRTTEQNVGLNADRPQVAHAVLGRLRLQLAGRPDEGDERQVDVQRVVAAHVLAELADGFQKRQALDVTDSAADLDERDFRIRRRRADRVLDLVRDMGNHLDGAAEVVPAAFLLDDALIDLAGGPVGVAGRQRVGEPLVVAQIQVRLGAVVGDVHLTVLVRAHRAGIDVDIRIELEKRDPVPVPLEQRSYRGGCQPLAERGHDPAGHENVIGQRLSELIMLVSPAR